MMLNVTNHQRNAYQNDRLSTIKKKEQWLTPVTPATLEVETRRIKIWGWPWQKVSKTPSHPIKAGHGGLCPSYQLFEKHK
jgi:hypothetical protein